jgi:hypothetical protein
MECKIHVKMKMMKMKKQRKFDNLILQKGFIVCSFRPKSTPVEASVNNNTGEKKKKK